MCALFQECCFQLWTELPSHRERLPSYSIYLGAPSPAVWGAHPALCCLLPYGSDVAAAPGHPPRCGWKALHHLCTGATDMGSSRMTGKPKAKNSSCRLTKAELNRVFSLALETLHQHGTWKPQCLGFPWKPPYVCFFHPGVWLATPGLGSTLFLPSPPIST